MTPWQHALLNTMTGVALVCTPRAALQAWNDEAVRVLTPSLRESDTAPMQLRGASLTQWMAPSAWQQLKDAASTDAPTVIVQLNNTPCRMQATPISAPSGAPHWLVRSRELPAPPRDPSHDLLRRLIESIRTPLASIRAAIETVQHYPHMGADAAAQFTNVIADQSVRLTELINEASTTYTAIYRKRHVLQPMDAGALLTWTQAAVQESVDIPVDTGRAPHSFTVRLDPVMMNQGLAFLGDRLAHATRCTALSVRLKRSGTVALLDLCAADGETVTEARVERWKEATIPWDTAMMQLTLHALLNHHDAQLWVEQLKSEGLALRFAFPTDTPDP